MRTLGEMMNLQRTTDPSMEEKNEELEPFVEETRAPSQRWRKSSGALGVGLLLVGTVMVWHVLPHSTEVRAAAESSSQFVEQGKDVGQVPSHYQEMEVTPAREACANGGEDCFYSKCCVVSGFKCYQKNYWYHGCKQNCSTADGWTCNRPDGPDGLAGWTKKKVVYQPGTSLYCFSAYAHDTGSTKKSYELDLLRTQLRVGASIFGCANWDVFSDEDVWLTPGPNGIHTKKVEDNGEFHILRRPKVGTWINTPLFTEVWKRIRDENRWEIADWTVKVDADAVFLPQRLVDHLSDMGVTEHGVYLENCPKVDSGFFGNLEVLSNKAVAILTTHIETCYNTLYWKGGHGWKYGPWGEDLFIQRCMDRYGVEKVEDFHLTTDGACPGDRPEGQKKNKYWKPNCAETPTAALHPFKKPEEYFACLGTIMKKDYF